MLVSGVALCVLLALEFKFFLCFRVGGQVAEVFAQDVVSRPNRISSVFCL